ncbi:hypothetical protein H6P81_003838 [Aristolochia fimbriata]|uniref:Tudor domain-containing protein n=1 Tax=Aristolochia fimbriata TaxID=158543 RepID=A0AAV7FDR1_ARIFI|nr:hypothetical protein H6P81_003838 [Aristolochia fimbriata]
MESNVERSDSLRISKHSRSLDLQSLYVDKTELSVGGDEIKNQGSSQGGRGVKREHGSSAKDSNPSEHVKKRKKGKREVPLSSFENCIGNSKRGDADSFPSGSPDPKRVGLRSNGFVSEQKKLNAKKYRPVPSEGNLPDDSISSQSLEGNNVKSIPKRPRGVFGRKKLDSNHVSKPAISSGSKRVTSLSNSTSRSSSEVHKSKLNDTKFKKKKFLQFKHGELDKNISCSSTKEEDGAVPLSGASISQEASGGAQSSRRRRRKSFSENQAAKASNGKPNKPSKDYEDDDQENLEQNAARMLSSRFDPCFTGFCSNASESTTQSANDSSFYNAGRKRRSASNGAQARVLRPRDQRKQKGLVRKRRHFYELNMGNLDPYWVLNKRIKVYWPLDQSWYYGLVKSYEPATKLHHVKYDDRDEEWINLQNERFKLLLLPTEKSCLEGGLRDSAGDGGPVGDNSGGFMDSETIISWLARSNHRVKTSSLKKRKKSSSLPPVLSENSCGTPNRCLDGGLFETDSRLLENPSGCDGMDVRDITERSMMASSSNRKVTLVYFRKRYRKREWRLDAVQGDNSGCGLSSAGSVNFLQPEHDGALQHCNVRELSYSDTIWWRGESFASLQFSIDPVNPGKVKVVCDLPLHLVSKCLIGAKHFWWCCFPPQIQYGTVMILWPKVLLEMLFVDNLVGLRFSLFEGSLLQAVEFLCMILSAFRWSNENGKLVDLHLPVTSIKFKLSGFEDVGRELLFIFYSFVELKNSVWKYLDDKLKHHCRVMKELPLYECTYANVRFLEEGRGRRGVLSSGAGVSPEGMVRRSRHGAPHLDRSSCHLVDQYRRPPPFILSLSDAPTFLNLHLKFLMEKNVASVSFDNCEEMGSRGLENSITLAGHGSSFAEVVSGQVSGITLNCSCVHSGVGTDVFHIKNDGDQKKSKCCQSKKLNAVETSVGETGSGKHDRSPSQAGSWQCGESQAFSSVHGEQCLPNRSERGCFTCCLNVSHGQDESSPFYREASNAQESSTDLACCVHSPKSTGPRSAWNRNRITSISSVGYRSKLWSDGRSDLFLGGVSNGIQKPRSPASYLLPFGSYEFGSKPRSHHRRGRPYKRIRTDNARWTADGSESPQRDPEALSCNANILIIIGDRGWRECGVLVVLEMVDHKDWRLLVKSSGETKYSYKAHQFLQPGITNRYTHAIMWKGGKDWTLEFVDRSQWNLFKELHEECYNRNVRAASVKNIPIPGVRLVEDSDDNVAEVPFVRSSPTYSMQVGTEVDMALDPSRVVYDLDTDDEKFISRMKSSSNLEVNKPMDMSDELFEKIMDMLEKVSYARQQDSFNDDEIEQFMGGLAPSDLLKTIYEHWQKKRKRKGMPLIRQFQPALWERYQQQLKEWELAVSKMPIFSNGFKENTRQKPPMFAFCLRPRGLEVPNKGSKQRSQRRFNGHNGAFSRDHDGIQLLGRKLNGFSNGVEKSSMSYHNHESDASLWHQSSRKPSQRDASWPGVVSSSGRSERNHYPNLLRNKSKKMGMYTSYGDSTSAGGLPSSQRSMGNRNGVPRYNNSLPEWSSVKHQYTPDGFQRHRVEQIGGLDYDEFRLRDASNAAQHATNMAKLKREKAQRLLHRAEVALHKAVTALMIADAMKAPEKESIGDG